MKTYTLNLFILLFLFLASFENISGQDSITVQNGYQKFYFRNGSLSSEGTMRDGKPDGYWKSYYENGTIKSEGNRKNFQIDSIWKFYNENGKEILEVTYLNGKKNGIKTSWLDKETIRENFVNDVKEGFTRYYFEDGRLKSEIPFVKGLEQGIGKEYSHDGNIIMITEYKKGFVVDRMKINRRDKDNLKQGKWCEFYPSGNIRQEGNYRDDKKDGYFKEYAENGDLISVTKYVDDIKEEEAAEIKKLEVRNDYYPGGKVKSSGTFKDGVAEGIYREFDTSGVVTGSKIFHNGILTAEGIILDDGSRQGHWKEFFPDSSLRSEGEYKDGKPVGEWKYFYQNGKLEQAGRYTSGGKLTGVWKWFYETGNLMREEEYRNGVLDGTHTEYDEDGKVIEQGDYVNGLEDGPWLSNIGDFMERGAYRDGLKNGPWKGWNLTITNGKTDSILSYTGNFIDDNPDGKYVHYQDNGNIGDEGNYIMGKKEGDWYKYNSDGTLFMIITYRNGTEIRYDGVRIKPPFDSGD